MPYTRVIYHATYCQLCGAIIYILLSIVYIPVSDSLFWLVRENVKTIYFKIALKDLYIFLNTE